jgi:hypothetical protein
MPFLVLSTILILLTCCVPAFGQQQPPRPIAVYVNTAQPLSFGAFYPGSAGGTVIIYPDGSRSSAGDVVLVNLGFAFAPAMFEVEGLAGTLVSILNGSDITLTGSNGGSMNLHLGASAPTSPLVIPTSSPSRTTVTVGGTLTVGNTVSNPPGSYTGTFNLTFIEQ